MKNLTETIDNGKQTLQNIKKYTRDCLNDYPLDIFEHFNSWGFHDYRLMKMELEHKSFLDLNVHFTISSDVEI